MRVSGCKAGEKTPQLLLLQCSTNLGEQLQPLNIDDLVYCRKLSIDVFQPEIDLLLKPNKVGRKHLFDTPNLREQFASIAFDLNVQCTDISPDALQLGSNEILKQFFDFLDHGTPIFRSKGRVEFY